MAGISKFERIVLGLTALFCLGMVLDLHWAAVHPPEVEVMAFRAAPPEEEPQEDHALLDGERIPVNTADAYDLQRLPGVGEKRAEDIIAYREAHGGFTCIEEFLLIPGIGEKTLEEIRLYAEIG